MKRLDKKSAVITGAGNGIGRASARMFAAEGAAVVIADIDGDAALAVAAEIKDNGGRAVAFVVDVASESGCAAMIEAAVAGFGKLDILLNNACMTDTSLVEQDLDFLSFNADIWRRTMDVNVLGPLFASKHALPFMIAQGAGSIIMTSSTTSLAGDAGKFSYGGSKAALNWYVKTLAASFGKQGIRCNAILPGVIRTATFDSWTSPEMVAHFEDLHMTPNLGTPPDVAAMAVYLASDEARFVTGTCIPVDGGYSNQVPHAAAVRNGRAGTGFRTTRNAAG